MGNNKPWEINSTPIIIVVVVNAVILDRLGEKWREGHGEGGSTPIVGEEGCGECKIAISDSHSSIMGLRGWVWGFVEIPPPPS